MNRIPKNLLIFGGIGVFLSGILIILSYLPAKQTTDTTTQTQQSGDANASMTTGLSNENISNINTGSEIKYTGEKIINILVPGFLYNQGLQKLAERIQSEKGIQIKYKQISRLSDYKNYIQNINNITGIDVILAPTDWIQNLNFKNISLSEDLTPYFHNVFVSYKPRFTFVPYGIDPMVTLTLKDENISTQNISLNLLYDYVLNYKSDRKLDIPLLWSMNAENINLLQNQKESFENYFVILYNLLYQSLSSPDLTNFSMLTDLDNIDSNNKYSLNNFQKIESSITKKNPECQKFPGICIMAYKYTNIKFGLLSDLDIWSKYFSGSQRAISEIGISNFPIIANNYMVRGRGWVVAPQTDKDPIIRDMMYDYIRYNIGEDVIMTGQSILGAINNIYDKQKSDLKYSNIMRYESIFKLMDQSYDVQKRFFDDTNILALIRGQYNKDLFLKNFQRTR